MADTNTRKMNTAKSRNKHEVLPSSQLIAFEEKFRKRVSEIATSVDPAHDILHFVRVVATAKRLCMAEKAMTEVVVPAAWLHDFVIVPKNDPRRTAASRLSATAACDFLRSLDYPECYLSAIHHAIEAHSFSAGISPLTLEAKIVQDANRLDGLGAIGVAPLFCNRRPS